MEAIIQKILEQNEEVKWEGKQDTKTTITTSVLGVIIIAVMGTVFYFMSAATQGTCTVNGVLRPMQECNRVIHIAAYIAFAIALIVPLFAYWRYKITNYVITDKRFLIKSGFVGADINSIYYDQVHSVSVNVGIIGKIFGTGNIMIDTGKITTVHNKNGDSTQVQYDQFSSIKNPYDVYKIVQEMLNKNKSALYSGKQL